MAQHMSTLGSQLKVHPGCKPDSFSDILTLYPPIDSQISLSLASFHAIPTRRSRSYAANHGAYTLVFSDASRQLHSRRSLELHEVTNCCRLRGNYLAVEIPLNQSLATAGAMAIPCSCTSLRGYLVEWRGRDRGPPSHLSCIYLESANPRIGPVITIIHSRTLHPLHRILSFDGTE